MLVAIPNHMPPVWTSRGAAARLQPHRRAPFRLAGEDEVGLRIVGRTVPLRAAGRARAEAHFGVDRERRVDILDSGDRRAIDDCVVGEIDAIEVPVLGRLGHELFAARRFDQARRAGDVPIVPVPGHKLEMAFIGPGPGVEHDDRAGIEIVALAHVVRKRRCRDCRWARTIPPWPGRAYRTTKWRRR